MKTKVSILAIVGILLLSGFTGTFLVENCSASGTTIYVSISNTSGPWDGTQEHPYQHIQDGIDASTDGDIVHVYSGTYIESVVIDKQIILEGSDKYNTVVTSNYDITTTSNAVSIKDFTINGRILISSTDIIIQGNIINWGSGNCISASERNDITIQSNSITSPTGILMTSCNNVTISDNSFDCEETCISIAFSDNNVIISNNHLENMKWGVSIRSSNNVEITENIVKDIIYKYGNGIQLSSSTSNCIISGNQIQDIPYLGRGIAIYHSSNNNRIYHNTFLGAGIGRDYAYDEGNNFWYNPSALRGNYWDNYRGIDNNGDGIGDTPYNISGGDNKDMYPLGHFNNPPSKPTDPYPPDGATDVEILKIKTLTLKVDVFDPDGDELKACFYDASTGKQIGNFNLAESGETASAMWGGLSYNRTYSWYVVVDDNGLNGEWGGLGPGLTSTSETFSFKTQPEKRPIADANGPYSGNVNTSILFDGRGCYDDDGYIVNYTWNFGDGKKEYSRISPTHVYSSAGNYTVILTVTDDDGLTDSDITTAYIIGPDEEDEEDQQSPTNETQYHPTADANGPYSGYINCSITFDASNSYDTDGTIISYEWNFGDEHTGTGISPSHTYDKAGNYTVTLVVTDNQSLMDSDTTTVTILEEKPDETPGFELILVMLSIALFLFWKRRR